MLQAQTAGSDSIADGQPWSRLSVSWPRKLSQPTPPTPCTGSLPVSRVLQPARRIRASAIDEDREIRGGDQAGIMMLRASSAPTSAKSTTKKMIIIGIPHNT